MQRAEGRLNKSPFCFILLVFYLGCFSAGGFKVEVQKNCQKNFKFFHTVLEYAPQEIHTCPGGEIGRHKGLKIPRP